MKTKKQSDIKLRIEELPAKTTLFNPTWDVPFTDSEKQDFRIFFGARNGFWHEDLEIRHVNAQWFEALKVSRDFGKSPIVLFSTIDPGFPLNDKGKVDWPK